MVPSIFNQNAKNALFHCKYTKLRLAFSFNFLSIKLSVCIMKMIADLIQNFTNVTQFENTTLGHYQDFAVLKSFFLHIFVTLHLISFYLSKYSSIHEFKKISELDHKILLKVLTKFGTNFSHFASTKVSKMKPRVNLCSTPLLHQASKLRKY